MLPVRHGDVEKQPEAAMRWLGLWLDRKLTFKACREVGSQGPGGRPPPPKPRKHTARPQAERCAEGRQSLCRADSALRRRSLASRYNRATLETADEGRTI